MLYLLALIAPPLAVLMAGKFWHAVLNFIMCCTILLIPVAMVHAWLKVQESYGVRHGETIVVNAYGGSATGWKEEKLDSDPGRKSRYKKPDGIHAPLIEGKPKMVPRRTRRTTDWQDW